MYGWMNRILRVNLSNSTITETPTREYTDHYVGGRGIASRIYAETVSPEVTAFDPDNRLIFMSGALTASGVQGATRMMVVGKSPGRSPEGYCYGSIGGFFPSELKKAGYDGVVIEGCAPKPVYLWIHDGKAEIRDASSLWGQGAYRTGEILQQVHGNKVRFFTTGVAGENMVRAAVVFGSHQATCIGGFGAVMGSKNLKALAVRGTGKPEVADREILKELNKYTVNLSKRFVPALPPGIDSRVKVIRKGGKCYQCALECVRNVYGYGEGLEDNRRCQSMVFYLPKKYGRDDEPIETLYKAPILANDYSIDTIELEQITDWLYACHREGILTEEETGLPLSKIGTWEFLENLVHSIAHREEFGDLLAEGLWRAGEKISKGARSMFRANLAPVGWLEAIPPRQAIVQSLIYQMEPRGNQAMFHEIAQLSGGWSLNQRDPALSPVDTKLFRRIAKIFWGSDEAADFSTYEGKALAAQLIQNRTCLKDSLGLCDFTWPMMYSLSSPDGMGDHELEAKIFKAVTGPDGENVDFDKCGDRIFNVQRLIMMREGRKLPEADFPYEHNFTDPLEAGMHGGPTLIPGRDDKPIDVTGNILDRDRFTAMLKDYYGLRGWDKETGQFPSETLAALGLDDLIFNPGVGNI